MLLWIQVGTSRREKDCFQARIVLQQRFDRLTFVPVGTIPKQQNRLRRVAHEKVAQKVSRRLTVHLKGGQRELMPGAQVQRPVEVGMVTLWTDPYQRGFADGRPDPRRGGLKIQAHLVQRDDLSVRMVLQKIGHFFSSSASNWATSTALGLLR